MPMCPASWTVKASWCQKQPRNNALGMYHPHFRKRANIAKKNVYLTHSIAYEVYRHWKRFSACIFSYRRLYFCTILACVAGSRGGYFALSISISRCVRASMRDILGGLWLSSRLTEEIEEVRLKVLFPAFRRRMDVR